MTFKTGETVVHPGYGAGMVTDVRALKFLDVQKKPYYEIQLLSQPETTVMVAVKNADKVGLRPTTPQWRLNRIWRILRSDPNELPGNHQERYSMLKEKIGSGNAFQVAEVLRDLAWRKEEKRKLTVRDSRLYDRSIEFLAGEIAGTQHQEVDAAEYKISKMLSQSTQSAM